jgi:CO/xanthine dehydrogenase Mo-binding subunit
MDELVRYLMSGAASALSRRSFLIGTGAAGITLAFAARGVALAAQDPEAQASSFDPTIWYSIDRDGGVTVNIAKAEMGQHVGTALARIVADELEADWTTVRLNYVDTDSKWGLMMTGASWSVWQNYVPLSRAGAAGRITLIEEAARLMGVVPADCTARNSVVRAGAKSLGYAEIVRRGNMSRSYSAEELARMPVKAPSERRLIGKETQALDVPSKTNGQAIYGIDAEVPGMIHGRPLVPPTRYGARINGIDDSAARSVPGYIRTVALDDPSGTVPGWAVVLADSRFAALAASEKVTVDWTPGDTATVSEAEIIEAGRKLIEAPVGGSLVVDDPGVDEAFASAATIREQSYTTSTVLHFQLEPVNALAYQSADERWEIHTGNQWQSLMLPVLAKALGVAQDRIVMRTYLIGGGFGRRLNGDYAVPAALAAKAAGRPVKLLCTREDDARFDSVRSPSIQRLRVAFDAEKNVTAMEHHVSAGWPTEVMAPFFMPNGANGVPYDPFAVQGADHWYALGLHRLRALSNTLAKRTFRPGWLRSVGSGWVNWGLESFIDEAAHAAGIDPVEFRLTHLKAEGRNHGTTPDSVGGASRQANVVRRVAERAGLGRSLPKDTGIGIATSFGQERAMPTWTACAAQVHVDRNTGKVTCQKLTLVIDAGTIVHPDGALAQAEGAALWGLSMALHEGTEFEQGQVRATNLNGYTPLRMVDVPELDIEFVASTEIPVGLGEPPTTVVAPAIGNAIFAAVGARLRHLPIRPQAVLDALTG